MLTQTSFYKVSRNGNIWIKAADCAHVLKVRSNNFLKGKVTKKLGNKKFRHIDEETFRKVFANDSQALAILKQFKDTGLAPVYRNLYTDISEGIYEYFPVIPADVFKSFPRAPGLPLKVFSKKLLTQDFSDLDLSIYPAIYLYTKILTYSNLQDKDSTFNLNTDKAYCVACKVKSQYPLFFDYPVKSLLQIFNNTYPKDLAQGLIKNWSQGCTQLNLLDEYGKLQFEGPLRPLSKPYYCYPIIADSPQYDTSDKSFIKWV
jgi:hypothetical protein